jgi:hypothetical protein
MAFRTAKLDSGRDPIPDATIKDLGQYIDEPVHLPTRASGARRHGVSSSPISISMNRAQRLQRVRINSPTAPSNGRSKQAAIPFERGVDVADFDGDMVDADEAGFGGFGH